MNKYKIVIIVLILAAVGFWFANKNDGDNNQEKIAFETGFVLLDDEKNLVWNEAVSISDEARAQYENKIEQIKADLELTQEKDQRLADYNNLAVYEKYLGNYRESYGAYLESLKIESLARVAWQNMADVLFKMKAFKSAEMAYKKAIELNKYIPESYVKLADYYKVAGDNAKIEETYKTAIETIKQSMESDTLVLKDYAEWLADEKRYNEAEQIYEQLMAKQPENKEAIERIVDGLKK
ncbi:MAG: hypothetical protein V1667_03060 [bacterium]